MGSSQPQLITKEFIRVKVTPSNVTSLRSLIQRMSPMQQRNFDSLYGKILEVASIEVPVRAIFTLVQYYDSPLRCFTFRDFQLAPTVEEFEKIFGCPIGERKPFLYSKRHSSMAKVVEALGIPESELMGKYTKKNEVEGLPRGYLEKKAHELADKKEWKAFMSVLALLTYGVVMFPKYGGLIDPVAIEAFLAFYYRKESPVIAILADLFLTFDQSYKKKDARIVGCLPALYVWLVTLVFTHRGSFLCPFEDFRSCEGRHNVDWERHLARLSGASIRWRQQWKEVTNVIWQCEGFPNVPLMGTWGIINCNPILSVRQLGYPLRGSPSSLALTLLYAQGFDDENLTARVKASWRRPLRKGKELGKIDVVAGNYGQWLKERACQVGLPHTCQQIEVPEPTMRNWKNLSESASLALDEATQRANAERKAREKYQNSLPGISNELKSRREERDIARDKRDLNRAENQTSKRQFRLKK